MDIITTTSIPTTTQSEATTRKRLTTRKYLSETTSSPKISAPSTTTTQRLRDRFPSLKRKNGHRRRTKIKRPITTTTTTLKPSTQPPTEPVPVPSSAPPKFSESDTALPLSDPFQDLALSATDLSYKTVPAPIEVVVQQNAYAPFPIAKVYRPKHNRQVIKVQTPQHHSYAQIKMFGINESNEKRNKHEIASPRVSFKNTEREKSSIVGQSKPDSFDNSQFRKADANENGSEKYNTVQVQKQIEDLHQKFESISYAEKPLRHSTETTTNSEMTPETQPTNILTSKMNLDTPTIDLLNIRQPESQPEVVIEQRISNVEVENRHFADKYTETYPNIEMNEWSIPDMILTATDRNDQTLSDIKVTAMEPIQLTSAQNDGENIDLDEESVGNKENPLKNEGDGTTSFEFPESSDTKTGSKQSEVENRRDPTSSWMTGLFSTLFGSGKKSQNKIKSESSEQPVGSIFRGIFDKPEPKPHNPLAEIEDPATQSGDSQPFIPFSPFQNAPALAGIFDRMGEPKMEAPLPGRQQDPVRPVFFTKRTRAAEVTEMTPVVKMSKPFEYMTTLNKYRNRLPKLEHSPIESEVPSESDVISLRSERVSN